jgi:hypothetical protein
VIADASRDERWNELKDEMTDENRDERRDGKWDETMTDALTLYTITPSTPIYTTHNNQHTQDPHLELAFWTLPILT